MRYFCVENISMCPEGRIPKLHEDWSLPCFETHRSFLYAPLHLVVQLTLCNKQETWITCVFEFCEMLLQIIKHEYRNPQFLAKLDISVDVLSTNYVWLVSEWEGVRNWILKDWKQRRGPRGLALWLIWQRNSPWLPAWSTVSTPEILQRCLFLET